MKNKILSIISVIAFLMAVEPDGKQKKGRKKTSDGYKRMP